MTRLMGREAGREAEPEEQNDWRSLERALASTFERGPVVTPVALSMK